jgi:hypothetical protein
MHLDSFSDVEQEKGIEYINRGCVLSSNNDIGRKAIHSSVVVGIFARLLIPYIMLDKDLSNCASLSNQRETLCKKGNRKDSGADCDVRKPTSHKSWADVVKLKPPIRAKQSRKPIIIR